jgi:hypothetical protein
MATNQYHLLSFIPAVESWEMPPALESLAAQLAASGQLRINADVERNFVRHGTADSDTTFSARELTDPKLLPATRRALARHVPRAAGEDAVEELLQRLRTELKKTRGIDAKKEMRVARCVVQAAHPSVIVLLLRSGTDVFVSYAHTVGDLLAVHEWGSHGDASGLQATSDTGTAVYISCGGDPFFEGENKTYLTDGFPALARMFVIGGQELGHFSDLKRTPHGITGRYSTSDSSELRASEPVRIGRRADIARVAQLQMMAGRNGLAFLRRAESAVAFYDKRMRYTPRWFLRQFLRGIARMIFWMRSRRHLGLRFHTYPHYRHGEALALFLDDMAFNLAPDADAYRRADPEAEEAIACIEALARVPQQVHKWGHRAVAFAWPQLYGFYYRQVIPGCVAAAGQIPAIELPLFQYLMTSLRRFLRKKPTYYP